MVMELFCFLTVSIVSILVVINVPWFCKMLPWGLGKEYTGSFCLIS